MLYDVVAVYVALYPDEGMDPENIFVAAILINMLRWPLMQVCESPSFGVTKQLVLRRESSARSHGALSYHTTRRYDEY